MSANSLSTVHRTGRSRSAGLKDVMVLGVDGGGSKTRALIADQRGRIRGRGEGGTSNHNLVGWNKAFAALSAAVEQALAGAGADRSEVVGATCLGMAGADNPADHTRLGRWLSGRRLGKSVLLVNDGELLLAAAGQQVGLSLVAGTGSICWGRNESGATTRAGGWGHLFGDEGSGYQLSIEALRLAAQTADGRGTAHALLRAVLRHLHLRDPAALSTWAYAPERSKAEIASLAPVVFRLATRGDEQALAMIEGAARDLAATAGAVATRLGTERPALALGGGLLQHQALLRQALLRHLPFEPASVTVVHEPARGAVKLALSAL